MECNEGDLMKLGMLNWRRMALEINDEDVPKADQDLPRIVGPISSLIKNLLVVCKVALRTIILRDNIISKH